MPSFRESIGLRQDADSWLKSMNNIIDRQINQGLFDYANENLNTLKNFGFETVRSKNGAEHISRNAHNKALYKQFTESMTTQIRKQAITDTKKAKARERNRKKGGGAPPRGDKYDALSEYYEIAQALQAAYNEMIAEAYQHGITGLENIDLYDAMSILNEGHGGRGDSDQYRTLARNTEDELWQQIQDIISDNQG